MPAWSEKESAEEEIAEATHPHQLSRFFSVHCSFDSLKKYSSFSFYKSYKLCLQLKEFLDHPGDSVMKRRR